jgi:hypothetical protein
MKSTPLILAASLLLASPAYSQPEKKEAPKVEAKAKADPAGTPSSAPVVPATSDSPAPKAATATAKPKPTEPKDLGEAIEAGKTAVAAAQAGQWWYFSSVVCLIIMFVLKATKVLKKMGRWRYIVLPILSLASALLAAFQGGVGLATAIGVFSSSWSMGMLQELVRHGILGKPHETTGAAGASG